MINGIYLDPGQFYTRTMVDFGNIQQYCKNYTSPGDWIIPVCGNVDRAFEMKEKQFDDGDGRKFNPDLMRVYKYEGNNIVLKNVRTIGKGRGVVKCICSIIQTVDHLIQKLPLGMARKVVKYIQSKYDDMFTDEYGLNEVTIWIPVERIECEEAFVISLFGRINILLS